MVTNSVLLLFINLKFTEFTHLFGTSADKFDNMDPQPTEQSEEEDDARRDQDLLRRIRDLSDSEFANFVEELNKKVERKRKMREDDPGRGAKMLEFFGRGQESEESNLQYCRELVLLAREAGLGSRDIVGRFIAGTRDANLKAGILDMGDMPSVENLKRLCDFKGFDLLFGSNLIHVLEQIFLSLDYESFKKCFQVCRQWREFLQSQSFRRVSKPRFYSDMWMDKSNLEKTAWTLKREVYKWVTNGREVAFIERIGKTFWLYHINETGEDKSVELKIASRHDSVSALWIFSKRLAILSSTDLTSPVSLM